MSWAFGSRLFALHTAVRAIVVSGIWFLVPDARDVVLPLAVAGLYLVTAALIPWVRGAWLKQQSVVEP